MFPLTDAQVSHLASIVRADIVTRSSALASLDVRKEPARYADALEAFNASNAIYAGLIAMQAEPENPNVSPLVAALTDKDPRASNPICVHGLSFNEPCGQCDLPAEALNAKFPPGLDHRTETV